MGKPLHWIIVLQPVSFAFAYRYDPWYRADTQRPVDVLTDVVNDLGVKILQQYSTHGNVAFSPTGVAFVLAALYEGSAGRGCQQIVEAIGLPSRDVTRIGLRDIHRRLRSYLNADGFLGGLTLSRENTRLRPEYEDILRFYGFDLSSIEQEANVTVNTGDSSGTTNFELPTSTVGSTIPMDSRNEPDTTTTLTITTLPSETTIAADAVQQNVTMDVIDVQSSTVTSTEPAVPSTSTSTASSLPAVTFGESTQPASTTVIADSQTNPITVLVANDQSSTVAAVDAGIETVANTIVPNAVTENAENANSNANVQVPHGLDTTTAADAGAMGDEIPTNISPTTIVVDATPVNNTFVTDANTVTSNSLIPAISTSLTSATNLTTSSSVIEIMTDNSVFSQSNVTSMDAPPARNTSEIISPTRDVTMTPIINDDDATASVPTTTISSMQAISTTASSDLVGNSNDSAITDSMNNQTISSLKENAVSMKKESGPDLKVIMNDGTVKDESPSLRERKARSPRGYFSSYPDEGIWMQNLEIWKSYSTVNPGESPAEDSSAEISFLVNGCDVSSVSASRYIAVLPFAYFPSLHAVALEFPLDDPRYNIILLMPTDKTDTHRLARDLSGKSLRLLRKRLQPTWVRATIPSFMLRGFVTLTSFLQRLGIVDVFEPRLADLSPMTSDLGVYARDVQQSIGVNIRNYMKPDRTHSRESSNVVPPRRDYYRYLPPGNGLFERAGPVSFTALHPFLYFIVDAETSVSLIAGRVEDPLNSRIL
ncbi:uncharacterized protein Ir93a isoform X2 [Anoplolepis gracilipes]|uniref:uncharacterized protein Ir93a isoform X2 n=1 Tax=Anoplolepis gracilipes TaxID=354296 RepID=UPI003B9E75CD